MSLVRQVLKENLHQVLKENLHLLARKRLDKSRFTLDKTLNSAILLYDKVAEFFIVIIEEIMDRVIENINGKDLMSLGWKTGRPLGTALKAANELLAKGYSKEDILALPQFSTPPVVIPKMEPCEEPKSLNIALHPETRTNRDNYDSVLKQMTELMKMPKIKRGSVMPDACPAGHEKANITVGGAIEVENAIIPSAHSADVCCSMYATFFRSKEEVADMVDSLKSVTRFGMGGRQKDVHGWVHHEVLDDESMEIFKTNTFLKGLEVDAYSYMADQGDGNHFAYVGKLKVTQNLVDSFFDNEYFVECERFRKFIGKEVFVLVTHHGSRGLGAKVYKRGVKEAENQTKKVAKNVPKTAAWIDYNSPEGKEYWEALGFISRWTKGNHQAIHRRFVEKINANVVHDFGNEHNFVWKRGDSFYHGKGATPAWRDENNRRLLGLIPLNMGREILLVLGNDNDKYLSFAPHGAGRNLSRTATMRKFMGPKGLPDEEKIAKAIEDQTKGLEVRWFCGKPDLTETPLAYKDATKVKEEIAEFDLAEVIAEIEPLGCIMAGDEPKPWLKKIGIL
jgi:RNA-splicing ligase RtcB